MSKAVWFLFLVLLVLGVTLWGGLSGVQTSSPADVKGLTTDTEGHRGFTLVPLSGPATILLLNHSQEIVHSWKIDAARARLLPDCSLLVVHGSKLGLLDEYWRSQKPTLRRYGWSGETLWEHTADDWIHHDVQFVPPNRYLYLVRSYESLPEDHPWAGATPEIILGSDEIHEVNEEGEILWRWKAHEHLDTVNCDWAGCEKNRPPPKKEPRYWDWSHLNTLQIIPENRWFDEGDQRFRPGNILTVPRNFWASYLLERSSGEVIWRYRGKVEDGKVVDGVVRSHETQMIEKGLPGAGNILLLDNGHEDVRSYSRVFEIDPTTKEIVWSYGEDRSFFTQGGGSVQRLPNGNTLISIDQEGRVIEVNPSGQTVWEFALRERISRAHRYPSGYCQDYEQPERQ